MPTNLVNSVLNSLTPEIVSRIAAGLGLERSSVERVISGAVPAVLAALASILGTPGGAERINTVVNSRQASGSLADLATAPVDGGASGLVESGLGSLSTILGGTMLPVLTSVLQTFAGTSGAATKGILGLIAPAVLGTLGREARASGLSPTSLLAAQKDTILRDLPAGMSELLKAGGLMPGGRSQTPAASPARAEPRKQQPAMSWLLPALVVLGLAAAWAFLSRPGSGPVDTATTSATSTTTATTTATTTSITALAGLNNIKAGDVDVGANTADAIKGVMTSASEISSADTAETAVPQLKLYADELASTAGLMNQLSPENRQRIAKAITAVRPSVDPILDRAMGLPGVATLIQPAVDRIRAELDTLAKG